MCRRTGRWSTFAKTGTWSIPALDWSTVETGLEGPVGRPWSSKHRLWCKLGSLEAFLSTPVWLKFEMPWFFAFLFVRLAFSQNFFNFSSIKNKLSWTENSSRSNNLGTILTNLTFNFDALQQKSFQFCDFWGKSIFFTLFLLRKQGILMEKLSFFRVEFASKIVSRFSITKVEIRVLPYWQWNWVKVSTDCDRIERNRKLARSKLIFFSPNKKVSLIFYSFFT